MWQRTAWIIALGLALTTRVPVSGQDAGRTELLISDRNWVRFEVAMGRLLATSSRSKQARQRVRRELPSGRTETLAVSIDRGLISLQYTLEDGDASAGVDGLLVRVVRRDQVEMEWVVPSSGEGGWTGRYRQPQGDGPVVLEVQSAEGPVEEFRAASLWHLILAHPRICDQHLIPVLRSLRPDWQIEAEAATTRALLLDDQGIDQTTSRREVELLVEQLSHPEFRVRQRADRELRSRGRSVLGYLDQLDLSPLDREQRLRISTIRNAITSDWEDTPSRVAAWMSNDRAAWLALLADEDPRHRRMARAQLSRLCEYPVAFDPDALPAIRAEQIASLRAELLRR